MSLLALHYQSMRLFLFKAIPRFILPKRPYVLGVFYFVRVSIWDLSPQSNVFFLFIFPLVQLNQANRRPIDHGPVRRASRQFINWATASPPLKFILQLFCHFNFTFDDLLFCFINKMQNIIENAPLPQTFSLNSSSSTDIPNQLTKQEVHKYERRFFTEISSKPISQNTSCLSKSSLKVIVTRLLKCQSFSRGVRSIVKH